MGQKIENVGWSSEGRGVLLIFYKSVDRLCVLVVKVPGCRQRGPGFDYQRYQIF
jgi:hypothetical protein